MKNIFSSLKNSTILLAALSVGAAAADDVKTDAALERVKAKISAGLQAAKPGLEVSGVELSVIPGLYKAQVENGPLIYSTPDGKYFIAGELFEVSPGKIVNLTDQERNVDRAKLVATIDKKDTIVFAPKDKSKIKKVMYVFTDVDCGYCQLLHTKIAEYNDIGIEVRYLAYPRAGINSASYNKIASAWCAANPNDALTKLKSRQEIPENICANNPVAAQFDLGKRVGISGTPALVFENGELIGGYVEPARLVEMINL